MAHTRGGGPGADEGAPPRAFPRWAIFAWVLGGLAALGAIGALLLGGGARAGTACGGVVTRPDRPVPPLAGRNVGDGSALRYEPGAVTVINVWGSWCGPCRVEQPILVRTANARPAIRFLGLDVQDNDPAARAFQKEFAVPYPSIADPSRELASRLGAFSTPSTFVADAGGIVRAQALGTVDVKTLECMLDLAGTGPR